MDQNKIKKEQMELENEIERLEISNKKLRYENALEKSFKEVQKGSINKYTDTYDVLVLIHGYSIKFLEELEKDGLLK
jgi:hypothetical protein